MSKDDWAIVVATAGDNVRDPTAEFGGTADGFENWLGANVRTTNIRTCRPRICIGPPRAAANIPRPTSMPPIFFTSAAASTWSRRWRRTSRASPINPDAQWAAYMLFKIPRLQWERGGMRERRARRQMGGRRAELSQELSAGPLRVRAALSHGRDLSAPGQVRRSGARNTSRFTAIPTMISPRASTPPNVTIARWPLRAASRATTQA